MKLLSVTLHFICVYSLMLSLTHAEECVPQSSCSCKTSTAEINLEKLSNPNPRFTDSNADYTYTYQPCVELKGGCGTVENNVAVCQSSTATNFFDCGDQATYKFEGDPAAENLKLSYMSTIGGVSRQSVIALKCSDSEGVFKFINEEPPTKYNFELKTKYACVSAPQPPTPSSRSGGVSTGSVLVILFFVFIAVYFVAGILFMKYARGAQGTELIPNYGFWTALPGLIKDGFLFTSRCCKTETTYSKI